MFDNKNITLDIVVNVVNGMTTNLVLNPSVTTYV